MSAFADTSGFLAVGNPADARHAEAADLWLQLQAEGARIYTTNYVVVETISILHHRFGVEAVRRFCEDVLPVVVVEWVDPETHSAAVRSLLAGGRGGPSLVDRTSFELMRRRGITKALAFDRHFEALAPSSGNPVTHP